MKSITRQLVRIGVSDADQVAVPMNSNDRGAETAPAATNGSTQTGYPLGSFAAVSAPSTALKVSVNEPWAGVRILPKMWNSGPPAMVPSGPAAGTSGITSDRSTFQPYGTPGVNRGVAE